jgi:hypothetical protein
MAGHPLEYEVIYLISYNLIPTSGMPERINVTERRRESSKEAARYRSNRRSNRIIAHEIRFQALHTLFADAGICLSHL